MSITVNENSCLLLNLNGPFPNGRINDPSTWQIREKIKMKSYNNKYWTKSFLMAGGFVVLISLSAIVIFSRVVPAEPEVNPRSGNLFQLKLPLEESPSVENESVNVTSTFNISEKENQDADHTAHEESMLETPLGKLVPVHKTSRHSRKFFAYHKVPYAKPPVGDLMFQSPQPVDKWDGVRNEKEVAPQCIQKVKYSVLNETAGEVDCLYMNIYTPHSPKTNENNTDLLPTLVYIHGGGYLNGNGSRYGAEYFMDEDVVLVTFQFRLGIFGFLNIGDGITGNMGHKDQVMALKWIQTYIKYFGGDQTKVLIFGNSSGGSSVGFHLLSPMSEGLFQRAILQSGGALLAGMVDSKPEITVESIGEATGCLPDSKIEFLHCLRNIDASELVLLKGKNITYAVTLEKNREDAFISDYPWNILQSGKINRASVIIGANSAEGLGQSLVTLKYPELTHTLNENWTELAPTLLDYESSAIDSDDMSLKIKSFYFREDNIGNETTTNLTNLFSDRSFIHRAKVEAVCNAAVNSVYLYLLKKESPESYVDKIKEGFPSIYYGPSHADEVQFLFPYNDYPYIGKQDSKYYNFSKILVKTWSRFAATGKPYTPWQDWKPIKPDENFLEWYMLDDQSEMGNALEPRMKFWDQFSASEMNYV